MPTRFVAYRAGFVAPNGKPGVRLLDDQKKEHALEFDLGIVNTVVESLLDQAGKAAATDAAPRSVQPMSLVRAADIALEKGDYGLLLHLDGGRSVAIRLTP